jgi:anti-sigma regulatory factor (Ser/Thr protein kinase)
VCASTPTLVRELECGPTAPGAARELLREWACATRPASCLEDALLLLSEVVTNAVIHAGPPLRVAFHCEVSELRVSVHDGASSLVDAEQVEGEGYGGLLEDDATDVDELLAGLDDHGRGLPLLDLLAPGWTLEPDAEGKTVTFAVNCDP